MRSEWSQWQLAIIIRGEVTGTEGRGKFAYPMRDPPLSFAPVSSSCHKLFSHRITFPPFPLCCNSSSSDHTVLLFYDSSVLCRSVPPFYCRFSTSPFSPIISFYDWPFIPLSDRRDGISFAEDAYSCNCRPNRLLALPTSPESIVDPSNYKSYCKRLPYLVKRQQEICDLDYNVLQTIGRGARIGVEECQHQFHTSRWNCSGQETNSSSFGGIISTRKLRLTATLTDHSDCNREPGKVLFVCRLSCRCRVQHHQSLCSGTTS